MSAERSKRPLVLALGLAGGLLAALPPAAGAQEQLASTSPADQALASAATQPQRRCLTKASDLGVTITNHTGERPEASTYADDFSKIVEDCKAGRTAAAMDEAAAIWAELTLHLPHRS